MTDDSIIGQIIGSSGCNFGINVIFSVMKGDMPQTTNVAPPLFILLEVIL